MSLNQPETTYLADYQPPVFLIKHVELHIVVQEQNTLVRSTLHIQRNPQADSTDTTLCLDGIGLQHHWAAIDDQRLTDKHYSIAEDQLLVHQVPDQFIFSSEVQIAPETNQALEGLYRSGSMLCTQCEAEGFRRITWYIDRPDVMATFEVRIDADKTRYPVLLSNGNWYKRGNLPAGQHYVIWKDPIPKPCYLFALVAGDLHYIENRHITASGRYIRLRIYVEQENIDKCSHAMLALQQAMIWDEKHYGREYDLEWYNIVAANDFNSGAMENKGLNIFNAKYVLAQPDTATDQDYAGIEGVIAHEYFHNWTGNRITCRDWFQLSLKEGLTVYRDQTFSADQGFSSVKRIDDVRLLRTHQFAEDASPLAHPVRPASYIEIRNFYTATVYEKGAEVVRMQALLLGPEHYRQAMDLYFARHDGQAVTIEDFMACMAEISGRDFRQFKHWYQYAGTPEIQVTDHYDPATQTYRLDITQQHPEIAGQTKPPAYLIPIALGLMDAQGNDMLDEPAGTKLLELHQTKQSFVFNDLPERPIPSLLRGFSAPVKLTYAYTDAQMMHLMAHDTDGFNRWDAAQTLWVKTILQTAQANRANQTIELPDGLIAAFRSALLDETEEPALTAEVLRLPSLDYLSDQMEEVDIDALHHARQALKTALAHALQAEIITRYEQMAEIAAYQASALAAGRRSLKNNLLSYIAQLDTEAAWDLVITQYQTQHNMTDVLAALTLIVNSEHQERQTLLHDFAERWKTEPLVMDKWFSVQARATRPDTLEQVQRLMQHPAFSLQNPNKVRALIGAYSAGNPVCFHAADGRGYHYLSQQVQAVDQFNPQIAARLVRGLIRWERYDSARQLKMQAALQRLLTVGVSKDVYEIVTRSIGAK